MEEQFVALDDFSFQLGPHGGVRRFARGECIAANVVALFGNASVPVVLAHEAADWWFCSACRSLHPVDAATATVDHHTVVWQTPVSVKVAMPITGGIREFKAGTFITDPMDVQAVTQTRVPLRASEAVLTTLECPKCHARFVRALTATYAVQEAKRLKGRDQWLAEQAERSTREHAEHVATKRDKSYARLAVMKAKKAAQAAHKEGR